MIGIGDALGVEVIESSGKKTTLYRTEREQFICKDAPRFLRYLKDNTYEEYEVIYLVGGVYVFRATFEEIGTTEAEVKYLSLEKGQAWAKNSLWSIFKRSSNLDELCDGITTEKDNIGSALSKFYQDKERHRSSIEKYLALNRLELGKKNNIITIRDVVGEAFLGEIPLKDIDTGTLTIKEWLEDSYKTFDGSQFCGLH